MIAANQYDELTIIEALPGMPGRAAPLLTKVIRPTGTKAYGRAKLFRSRLQAISRLDELHNVLLDLADQPHCAVIRGKLRPGLDPSNHPRNGQTFEDRPHFWAMFDVDGVDAPPGVSPTSEAALDFLIGNHFPAEFHKASYVAQWSSSAGLAGSKIRAHFWFWMTKPLNSLELKSWAKKALPTCDLAVLQAVQVHYVASPIFDGVADPLPGTRIRFISNQVTSVTLEAGPTDVPRNDFPSPPAVMPLGVDQTGLLLEGRENWLRQWGMNYLRSGAPRSEMQHAAAVAFYSACSNADGKWPSNRIVSKIESTLRRADAGDIPGIAALGLAPHYTLNPEPNSSVRDALRNKVADYFAGRVGADVLALAIPPGVGKTKAVSDAIKDAVRDGKRGQVFVHSLAMADELAAELGPIARVIRGRGQIDPATQQPVCLRADMAQAVAEAGLSVQKRLCETCLFATTCQYQAQFSATPVAILQHTYLKLQPRPEFRNDFLVIDESFWPSMLETGEVPWSEFFQAFPATFDHRLTRAIRQPNALAELRKLPRELLKNAATAVYQGVRAEPFNTSDTPAVVPSNGRRKALASRILRTLATELDAAPERDSSHIVKIFEKEDKRVIRYSLLSEARALTGGKVLVIDADAELEILQRVFHGRIIEFDKRHVRRNAEVVQMTGSAVSLDRLSSNKDLLGSVKTFATWWGKGTALFAPKRIRCEITGETKDAGTLPVATEWGDVTVGHLGHLKGTNFFEDHHTAIVVSRSQMPVSALEAMSGLFLRDKEPLDFAGTYVLETRGHNHPSGLGASVQVHPDRRFQTLLEARREREVVQAIDRLRLIWGKRKTIFILTNLVLPIEVTRLVPEAEVLAVWRILAMENGGLILRSAKWLASTYPTRFRDRWAAQDWLKAGWQKQESGYQVSNSQTPAFATDAAQGRVSFNPLAPFRVWYRPAGGRQDRAGWGKEALYVGPPLTAPAAVERALGAPHDAVVNLGGLGLVTNMPLPCPAKPDDGFAAMVEDFGRRMWEARFPGIAIPSKIGE